MNKTIIVIVLLVILFGGFALVASHKKVTQTAPATTNMTNSNSMKEQPTAVMSPAASGGAKMTEGDVKEFTVVGQNFSFTPSTLTVNKGDQVKITFKNSGGTHDFVLDKYNVQTKPIESGASETVSFTADKVGTFDYYCSVANHRAMGMQGKLTVK